RGGGWAWTRVAEGLARSGGIPAGGQHAVELATGGDAELGEDVAEVVLGGARADEQPGADLRVRQALPSQPRHLGLLRGQRRTGPGGTGGRDGARAGGLPGSPQLTAGPPRGRLPAPFLPHPVG